MPRPIPWLPRLPEIRRSVKHSARSHYERKDIERLFELQPRAAQAPLAYGEDKPNMSRADFTWCRTAIGET